MADEQCCIHINWHFDKLVEIPMMTASKNMDDKGLGSLKGHAQTASMGTQADNCTKTAKAIAKHVGWVFVTATVGVEWQGVYTNCTGSSG